MDDSLPMEECCETVCSLTDPNSTSVGRLFREASFSRKGMVRGKEG